MTAFVTLIIVSDKEIDRITWPIEWHQDIRGDPEESYKVGT